MADTWGELDNRTRKVRTMAAVRVLGNAGESDWTTWERECADLERLADLFPDVGKDGRR